MKSTSVQDGAAVNAGPLLLEIAAERVFEITKLPNGNFQIQECCDRYFAVDLTAAELQSLGKEIMVIANR